MKKRTRTISNYIVKPILIKKLLEKNGYKLEHIAMSGRVKGFGINTGGNIAVNSHFINSETTYSGFVITNHRTYTTSISCEDIGQALGIEILLNKNSYLVDRKDNYIQIIKIKGGENK